MASAYLLVSHGSRDPRPQAEMEQLARLVLHAQRQLAADECLQAAGKKRDSLHSAVPLKSEMIGTAYLELYPDPLHEQIRQFGIRAASSGYDSIQVVPIFLLPGTHVMEDIPDEVAIAQQALEQKLKVELRPHLGSHPGLKQLMENQMAVSEDVDAWILLAHGSRRVGSEQIIEALAKQLGAVSAYWAVPPSLSSRVEELVNKGYKRIGIVPYFLFAGGITDAIAQSVDQLRGQFTNVSLLLADPLGASVQLADLIWDLVKE